MEPVSIVLISAAAGGIASKLSEQITEYVCSFFHSGHAEDTRARAQRNADAFAEALLRSVDARLAQAMPLPPRELEDRLTDPDIAATLETATRTSARTSDPDRHGILANLVAERLASPSVTVDTVAAVSAIEMLPRLAPLHLEMLGLLVAVEQMPPHPGEKHQDRYIPWMKELAVRYDLTINYGRTDLLHLASLGCVRESYQRSRVDSFRRTSHLEVRIGTVIFKEPAGLLLKNCWDRGLEHVELLPTGSKIGWALYESRRRGDRGGLRADSRVSGAPAA